jgi:hypothetical protein
MISGIPRSFTPAQGLGRTWGGKFKLHRTYSMEVDIMPYHPDSSSPLEKIDGERSMRVRDRPFTYIWDFHRRDDAFNDALLATIEALPDHAERGFDEVARVFGESAREAVNRVRAANRRTRSLCGDELDDLPSPKTAANDSGRALFSETAHRVESERLLFVRMVIKRGFLPPDDAIEPAARAACREHGIAEPTPAQIQSEAELLRQGRLSRRKRTTGERLADIDHYHHRARQLAHQCTKGGGSRTLALAVADTMEQIRRQQARANHAKKRSPTVPLFAELRAHATHLAANYDRWISEALLADDRDVIFALLAVIEMFAALFPRADQLGRCLRLCRHLDDEVQMEPLHDHTRDLEQDLESLHVLAKVREPDHVRLTERAVRLSRLVDDPGPDSQSLAALYLTILWLQTATETIPPRHRDELPALDACWWLENSTRIRDEHAPLGTAVHRLYRSCSPEHRNNRKER